MSKKRKAIIHIGAHKTGSTAIQKFFLDFADYFKSNYSIVYPKEKELIFLYGHHYLAWRFTIDLGLDKYRRSDVNRAWEIFTNYLRTFSNYDILISSENFMLLRAHKVKEFVDEINDFFDETVVILYVRRQDEASLSLYHTDVVHNNETKIFLDWFQERKWIFDYYNAAKKWEMAGCKVKVRIYDNTNNFNVIDDFIKCLSSILEIPIDMPSQYNALQYKGINVSVPSFIAQIIRYYNSKPSRDKVVPVLRKLGFKLIEKLPDLPKYNNIIPPSQQREILNYYRENNLRLTREYIGLNKLWYDEDSIPTNDQEWMENNNFEGKQIFELANAVLKLIGTVQCSARKFNKN